MSQEEKENSSYKPQTSVLEKNLKLIIGLVIVGLLVGGGITVKIKMERDKELKAFSQLAPIQTDYIKKRDDFKKSEMGALAAAAQKKEAPSDAQKSGDITKDYGETVDKLKSFAQNNQETRAGAQAALYLYELFKDYEKTADVAPIIESTANKQPEGLTKTLLQIAAGNSFAEADQCDQAIKHFEQVANKTKILAYLKGEASLRAGLCYEKLNQLDRARDMYQRAVDADPKSQISKNAKRFLKVLSQPSATKSSAKDDDMEGKS